VNPHCAFVSHEISPEHVAIGENVEPLHVKLYPLKEYQQPPQSSNDPTLTVPPEAQQRHPTKGFAQSAASGSASGMQLTPSGTLGPIDAREMRLMSNSEN